MVLNDYPTTEIQARIRYGKAAKTLANHITEIIEERKDRDSVPNLFNPSVNNNHFESLIDLFNVPVFAPNILDSFPTQPTIQQACMLAGCFNCLYYDHTATNCPYKQLHSSASLQKPAIFVKALDEFLRSVLISLSQNQ